MKPLYELKLTIVDRANMFYSPKKKNRKMCDNAYVY